jgi:hypothetical protein
MSGRGQAWRKGLPRRGREPSGPGGGGRRPPGTLRLTPIANRGSPRPLPAHTIKTPPFPSRCPHPPIQKGEYRVDAEGNPIMLKSLMYKLSYYE